MEDIKPLPPRAARSVLERLILRGQAEEAPALARLREAALPVQQLKGLSEQALALIQEFGKEPGKSEAQVEALLKLLKS